MSALILLVSTGYAQSTKQMTYKVLIADEGNQKVHYVDMNNDSKTWSISIGSRDMQLIGNGRLLLHTSSDFQEYELATHNQIKKVPTGSGTIQTVFRTNPLGNTTYVGVDGAELKIIDAVGSTKKTINISKYHFSTVDQTNHEEYFLGGTRIKYL